MSNAYNLSLLASRNNLGNAGDAFISQGNDIAPSLGPLSAGVLSLSGINQLTSQIGVNKSTGVVTISAEPHLCELDVPGWDKGQHITQWSTLQKYLSATAFTNRKIPASASYVELFGSTPSSSAYFGGTLAPNGKIYLAPYGVTHFAFIDPSSNTVSAFTSFVGAAIGGHYEGGVLHTNGKIYMIPHSSSLIRVVDPSNNTVSVAFTLINALTDGNFSGATLTPNGKIYLAPYYQSCFTVIDPNANTISTFGAFVGVGGNYVSAVVAPNGKIYFSPFGNSLIRVVDPSNNSVAVVNTITNASFAGCVLAPNGKIYHIPYLGRTQSTCIDPTNDSISTVATFSGGGVGAVLSPNGEIYLVPGNLTVGQFIDPNTNTVGTYNFTFTGNQAYSGGVLASNGKIYLFPWNATQFAALNNLNNNNFNLNVCTNPMFNKL
jgi:streptogramin lyase